ncbi:hypothetical protein DH2020_005731 [Rehmannia glutinosa]|uniref:UDP-glucose 4-epimerase n=1 Tax=Rehmannia glutinosa TaxID=99300 RepID=A0ABR0XGY5_REHGL
MSSSILVTGGAGYIGSHTVLQLLLGGYKAVVVDNLDNSSEIAIKRVQELAGKHGSNLTFHKIDLRDKPALEKLFASEKFEAVIHFAGLKAVGESVQKPLMYYDNNLNGTIVLLEVMAAHGCKKLVFSSSATVYGSPKVVPCTEEFPISALNPYGRTKLVRILVAILAKILEDPKQPYALCATSSRWKATCTYGLWNRLRNKGRNRDGHIAALDKLSDPSVGCEVYNLGTGKGTSVLEMVAAFEKASGKKIPLVMAARRPGDAEVVYAETDKAERELKWKAKYGIDEMCRDQWNWASKNPYGEPWIRDDSNFFVSSPIHPDVGDIRVSDLIIPGLRQWDIEMIENLFNERDCNQIIQIHLNNVAGDDRRVWHFSKNGRYLVKSGYKVAVAEGNICRGDQSALWKKLWKLKIPPKGGMYLLSAISAGNVGSLLV